MPFNTASLESNGGSKLTCRQFSFWAVYAELISENLFLASLSKGLLFKQTSSSRGLCPCLGSSEWVRAWLFQSSSVFRASFPLSRDTNQVSAELNLSVLILIQEFQLAIRLCKAPTPTVWTYVSGQSVWHFLTDPAFCSHINIWKYKTTAMWCRLAGKLWWPNDLPFPFDSQAQWYYATKAMVLTALTIQRGWPSSFSIAQLHNRFGVWLYFNLF